MYRKVWLAPFTDLERVVLDVERSLTSADFLAEHLEVGEDVKVMGVRYNSRIDLTVGCAFIARHIRDAADYSSKKDEVRRMVLDAARRVSSDVADVVVNAADDVANGNVFITVTGTSAEAGDDGEVGRGNRVSGLITPYRATTMEAAAGKNSVSHVGKLYNLVAQRTATFIVANVPGVRDAACILVSQIGRAINDPHIADVQVGFVDSGSLTGVREVIGEVVRTELDGLSALRDALLDGRVPVF